MKEVPNNERLAETVVRTLLTTALASSSNPGVGVKLEAAVDASSILQGPDFDRLKSIECESRKLFRGKKYLFDPASARLSFVLLTLRDPVFRELT